MSRARSFPWPDAWPFRPSHTPAATHRAVVASTDEYASRVGLDVLAAGGTAVDAAVAVSFALAVVNPEAGNVGGSGFLVVRTPGGELAALDYRSTAPAAATRDMFLDARGELGEAAQVGPLAAAVPGSVRGLWDAHGRFGRRPWSALVEPAVHLAQGFEVRERLTRSFPPHIVAGLRRFPESRRIFLPGDAPPRLGDVFRQAELARTLERIRDRGADGFYRGETAAAIEAEMERAGGIMTQDDLQAYRALWREPVRVRYRDHVLASMPLSSSGGVTLALICNLLSDHTPGALPWHGPEHVHLLAEVWRRAFADRNHYLADPDFADIPLTTLLSADYGRWRARDIRADRATPSAEVAPGIDAFRPRPERHTTHVSIVDAEGMAVSLTTTLNTWYGSKAVVPGTGVLLNNEMDDFTARPGTPNHFGLVQGEANAIEPGKRMLSAMTPTLVLDPDGALSMVVGTPGGSTIITTVFQVISNVVDHGMPLRDAVFAPRVHHQHLPDLLQVEPGGLPAEVMATLRALGHPVQERSEHSGDVQAILVEPGGGLAGVADPRRGGVALGL